MFAARASLALLLALCFALVAEAKTWKLKTNLKVCCASVRFQQRAVEPEMFSDLTRGSLVTLVVRC